MAFSFSAVTSRQRRKSVFKLVLAASAAIVLTLPLHSKEPILTAIELYDGPNGPAYVHITDALINGKIELRNCAGVPKIDKSTYGKLPKILLGPGSALEYGRDGALQLLKDGAILCVVPSNLKFAKNGPSSPAELAGEATLQGKILSTGADANQPAPPLKPGVKLVFVSAPDVELAEFLRAERASTIALWQDYIGKFPTAPHTARAKEALTSLLVQDGSKNLDIYRNSAPPARDNAALKTSRARAAQALGVLPNSVAASKLDDECKAELTKLITAGQNEIQAYKEALISRAPGYSHLVTAAKLAGALTEIDPHYAPALPLENDATHETNNLESKMQSADSLVAAKRYDEGYAAIAPYMGFAKELPRIEAVAQAVYDFHFKHGDELAGTSDWDGASKEYQKAAAIRKTDQVTSALQNAEKELEAATDKHAVELAVQQSQALATSGQVIQAYELLAALPLRQRTLVSTDMQNLAPAYVDAAAKAADEIQQAHDPIKGLQDELEMERAYGYLKQANTIGADAKLKDRQQDFADKLSGYYLTQAKKYMAKPLGTGAGLGWWYLEKAVPYNASNLEAVRDERVSANAAYRMRASLSVRVQFRDQTSRRDSAGFADQLADALATGLETSGLSVVVIRPGDNPPLAPNFELIGDVVEHRPTVIPTSKPKESKYRAGEEQIPNEDWNKANREYEMAKMDLQKAQSLLQAATARGKKKETADANDQVTVTQKRVEDDLARLDAIPKTLSRDLNKPYTYTEKTYDMEAAVQLQFRINDATGGVVEPATHISKKDSRKYVVLEDVKPEDTEGVKKEGTIPDEIQFLTDVENVARDELLKKVRESVLKFPDIIFARAQRLAGSGDNDGAGESYILYLNSTAADGNSKREQAEKFLRDQFNIKRASIAGATVAGN